VLESRVAGFVLILMAAAAVAAMVRVIQVPYVSVMAVVGMAAGPLLGHGEVHLTPALILFVLVPGLLFEASFNLSWAHLRANLIAVTALATLGVLLTTAVVGLLGHAALGLEVPIAILFGAMVAPTDPVAVVAVFRKLRVPERLVNLVEAESLFNDGTGVILFTVALSATAAGEHPSILSSLVDFLRLALGGLALGLLVGFGLSLLTSRVDDFEIEMTLTAIAAYGGYLLAEEVHVSGILAVVAAGLVLGNYGRSRGMSEATRQAVERSWSYVAFALNSVVFVLIGLDVPIADVVSHLGVVLFAAGIALLARAVAVYVLMGPLHLFRGGVHPRWQHLLVWGGLRGALALALALSVSSRGGQFSLVSALVYGVVLASILVQGVTIGPFTRLLLRSEPEPGQAQLPELWPDVR
jgi:CPA1 family monovalent cation:H+ antiporter